MWFSSNCCRTAQAAVTVCFTVFALASCTERKLGCLSDDSLKMNAEMILDRARFDVYEHYKDIFDINPDNLNIMCFKVVKKNEIICMSQINKSIENIFESWYIYHTCKNIEKLFINYEDSEIVQDIDLRNRKGFLDGFNYEPIKP